MKNPETNRFGVAPSLSKGGALALCALALFCAAGAAAEPLSIKEAVRMGLRQNHALRAATASTEAAREGVGKARGQLLPRVTLEERYMRTNNPTYAFSSKLNQERFSSADFAIDSLNGPEVIDDFQTTLSLEVPVFVRQARVGLKMARQERAAAEDDLVRKKEEAAFNIVKAYLLVDTASGLAVAASSGVEDAKEHLRVAEARHSADLGLYSDVLRARTGLLEAEQRLVTAQKDLRLAKRSLGMLLGLDEEAETDSSALEIEPRALEQYLASAVARSDVRSMAKRRENAANGVELANSAYFPMIGVGGSYYLNDHSVPFGGEGESWQVAAFLRWTLFDGAARGHEAAQARLRSVEAAERLEGMKKAVSFSVHQAYMGVEEAKKNTELAEAALKSAEEGERLIRLRYENSLSTMAELLDAQAGLDGARAAVVMRKNAYLTAVAALSFEGGTILQDLGVQEAEASR